jgi:hypothetical protein
MTNVVVWMAGKEDGWRKWRRSSHTSSMSIMSQISSLFGRHNNNKDSGDRVRDGIVAELFKRYVEVSYEARGHGLQVFQLCACSCHHILTRCHANRASNISRRWVEDFVPHVIVDC